MPVVDAWAGPWLLVVAWVFALPVTSVVDIGRLRTLLGLAFIGPMGVTVMLPWLCIAPAAPAPGGGPPWA